MILKVIFSLNNSMILWFFLAISTTPIHLSESSQIHTGPGGGINTGNVMFSNGNASLAARPGPKAL